MSSCKPKIGLLPLYVKLYDDVLPEMRHAFKPFLDQIVQGLESHGLEVHQTAICRMAQEIGAAVDQIERSEADLLVTLHLAYSPSQESIDVLRSTSLPLLMLDTTMHNDFGLDTDPDRILYNHGIHGVQDLASVLRRHGRPYRIVAGSIAQPPIFDRVAGVARAALAARRLREMRVLRIGETFQGMGDFAIDDAVLADRLGISVHETDIAPLADAIRQISPQDIEDELNRDRKDFQVEASDVVHRRSVRVGLGLRRMLDEGGYGALSFNFLAFDSPNEPVDTAPFLEVSKALSRGLGYSGEGDVLNAALVGALNSVFGRTNFSEMFCPDWQGNAVFLSHMGESNPACSNDRPRLIEKDFPWSDAQNPAILIAPPAPGPAILANLSPGPEDAFDLLLAPVTMLGDTTNDAMRDVVRGWMQPQGELPGFLEEYSWLGGTHHSAMAHVGDIEALTAFAEYAGLGCHIIGNGS